MGRRKWGWQDRWHCYNSDLMSGYQGRRDASRHSESWRRSGSGRRQREAVKITHLCPGNGERQGEGSVPGQASLRTMMEPAQEPETLCGVHTQDKRDEKCRPQAVRAPWIAKQPTAQELRWDHGGSGRKTRPRPPRRQRAKEVNIPMQQRTGRAGGVKSDWEGLFLSEWSI